MRWPALVGALLVPAALAGLSGCGETGTDGSGGAVAGSSTAVVGNRLAELDVPGAQKPVVLTREDHPRGGYQLHLYVDLGKGAHELTDVDHNPVIPFVATDTQPGTPVSATCTADGFAVTEADATSSGGSWDVHRTTYRVDGDRAVPLDRTTVDKGVSDDQLRQQLPDLFTQAMFTDCRS
jgi:hypothetical protein